ncbi:hypothetical protein OQA88_4644 [Cercophora sp. LCS_1]
MIYQIVLLVLLVILLASLIALAVLSHRNIPKAPADPSRTFLPYYTSTVSFLISATFLYIIVNAIGIATRYAYYSYSGRLYDAVTRIATVANLMQSLSLVALIQTIARFAIGVRVAASSGAYTSSKFAKTINVLTIISAITFVLWFIWQQVALTLYRRYLPGTTAASLAFAIISLIGYAVMLIAGITTLVYGVKAFKVSKGKQDCTGIGKRVVIVASILLLILAWSIVNGILFGMTLGGSFASWWDLIDIFIGKFTALGVLTVVYLVAKRKEGGLWSEASLESGRNSGEVVV